MAAFTHSCAVKMCHTRTPHGFELRYADPASTNAGGVIASFAMSSACRCANIALTKPQECPGG